MWMWKWHPPPDTSGTELTTDASTSSNIDIDVHLPQSVMSPLIAGTDPSSFTPPISTSTSTAPAPAPDTTPQPQRQPSFSLDLLWSKPVPSLPSPVPEFEGLEGDGEPMVESPPDTSDIALGGGGKGSGTGGRGGGGGDADFDMLLTEDDSGVNMGMSMGMSGEGGGGGGGKSRKEVQKEVFDNLPIVWSGTVRHPHCLSSPLVTNTNAAQHALRPPNYLLPNPIRKTNIRPPPPSLPILANLDPTLPK